MIEDELSFDSLLTMAEADVAQFLQLHGALHSEVVALNTALNKLKQCTGECTVLGQQKYVCFP